MSRIRLRLTVHTSYPDAPISDASISCSPLLYLSSHRQIFKTTFFQVCWVLTNSFR